MSTVGSNGITVVDGRDLADATYAPDALAPIEVTRPLVVNQGLVALTRAAVAWVTRRPLVTPAAPPRPLVRVGIDSAATVAMYVPEGVAAANGWTGLLLAPQEQATDNPGDAGIFKQGTRGNRSHMAADIRTARTRAKACLAAAQSSMPDFSAVLSPQSSIVNVWRYGPGAIAIDFMIGAAAPTFRNLYTCTVSAENATLREAYVPAGGFYRPIGARAKISRVSDSSLCISLDLRHAHVRATFMRVIVAWDLSLAGSRRQCLLAMRAPSALPAPGAGAVYAGGTVVGNGAHPAAAGMAYGFCRASAPSTVAAVSPEGYPVFVAASGTKSALYGEGASFVLDVANIEVEVDDYALLLTVVPVGDWAGVSDARSVMRVEVDVGNGWTTAAAYSFSALPVHKQSYPSQVGAGEHAATTGALAVNKYQFGQLTPMLVVAPPAPAVHVTYPSSSLYVTGHSLPAVAIQPSHAAPAAIVQPAPHVAQLLPENLQVYRPCVMPAPAPQYAGSPLVVMPRAADSGEPSRVTRASLDKAATEDTGAVAAIQGMITPLGSFAAMADAEYRLYVPIASTARRMRVRVTAARPWALRAAQLWAAARRSVVTVASATDMPETDPFDIMAEPAAQAGNLPLRTDAVVAPVTTVSDVYTLAENRDTSTFYGRLSTTNRLQIDGISNTLFIQKDYAPLLPGETVRTLTRDDIYSPAGSVAFTMPASHSGRRVTHLEIEIHCAAADGKEEFNRENAAPEYAGMIRIDGTINGVPFVVRFPMTHHTAGWGVTRGAQELLTEIPGATTKGTRLGSWAGGAGLTAQMIGVSLPIAEGDSVAFTLSTTMASSYPHEIVLVEAYAVAVDDGSPVPATSSEEPEPEPESEEPPTVVEPEESSTAEPEIVPVVKARTRRNWPDAWYVELLDGLPGTEWNNVVSDVSDSNDTHMVPAVAGTSLKLHLEDMPAHTQATIGIEFFVRGAWLGNDAAVPPGMDGYASTLGARMISGVVPTDIWRATVATVVGATQTFPYRDDSRARLIAGYGADEMGALWQDEANGVFTAEISVPHVGDTLDLEIYAANVPDGGAWGVSRVYVAPSTIYSVNEAFDAAPYPQPLIPESEIPALVLGRKLLGAGFKSDLVFVNRALPLELAVDAFNEVRAVRFPVFGDAEDVARFWSEAESDFESSPARAFDLRSLRVGYAGPDKYPAALNPMAVMLGHAMGGNLLIVKLTPGTLELPVSLLNDVRKRLPLSCGLLVHVEMSVESSNVMDDVDDIEVADVVDADSTHAWTGDATARVAVESPAACAVYVGDAAQAGVDVSVALDGGVESAPFLWWEHVDAPFVRVAKDPSAGWLTVTVWPAHVNGILTRVYLDGADMAQVVVPEGGTVQREAGALVLRCADADALTAPLEFVMKWSNRTVTIAESAVVAGYI